MVTVTDAHGHSMPNVNSIQSYAGYVISTNEPLLLKSVTKSSGTGATKAYCFDYITKELLESADFSGHTATFDDLILVKGKSYIIEVDNGGSAYNQNYSANGIGYPTAGTHINWVAHTTNQVLDGATLYSVLTSITTELRETGAEAYADGTVRLVGSGSVGTRYINKDYPNTEGLTAGTTITAKDPTLEET